MVNVSGFNVIIRVYTRQIGGLCVVGAMDEQRWCIDIHMTFYHLQQYSGSHEMPNLHVIQYSPQRYLNLTCLSTKTKHVQ